jgi:putative membrane protein
MEPSTYHLALLPILSTLVYALIGLGVFALALFVMDKVTPFSISKEIEQDQNIALAIIVGSVFVSLAIIIQAAIRWMLTSRVLASDSSDTRLRIL